MLSGLSNLSSIQPSAKRRPESIFSAASSCMPGIRYLYVSRVIPTETLRDDLGVHAALDELGRVRVAQVVEAALDASRSVIDEARRNPIGSAWRLHRVVRWPSSASERLQHRMGCLLDH